jgi:sugar/nucleoside kinase (ribokinase family)
MRRGFLTGGSWCLDRNRYIERWPFEDSVGTAWGLEARGGGSACNLALDMKTLDPDMPVETIGLIGDDEAGRKLQGFAEAAGISASGFIVLDGATTHLTDCFVSKASGKRTHITDAGVGGLLSPDHFSFEGRDGRIFHLGLPGVHPVMDNQWHDEANGWVAVLRKAKAAGFKTNLELLTMAPERQREIVLPCLPHLDMLVVNDVEIGALASMETRSGEDADPQACADAAMLVLDKGAMDTVAVHAPVGALAVTRGSAPVFVPSFAIPESEVAGPNGAGDAFAAGFLYGVHEGWALSEALRLGHAAAACSLRSPGTTDGVLSWRACLDTAQSWGPRESDWR